PERAAGQRPGRRPHHCLRRRGHTNAAGATLGPEADGGGGIPARRPASLGHAPLSIGIKYCRRSTAHRVVPLVKSRLRCVSSVEWRQMRFLTLGIMAGLGIAAGSLPALAESYTT